MFIDASAFVAYLGDEPRADDIRRALDAALAAGKVLRTSPIARIEAVLGLAAKAAGEGRYPPGAVDDARAAVDAMIEDLGVRIVPIMPDLADKAIDAAARFHKKAGHPARLNFGDCLAYACARAYRDPLLFVGNDFTHTDIESVLDDPTPTASLPP
jgi:ribonuclease VapC